MLGMTSTKTLPDDSVFEDKMEGLTAWIYRGRFQAHGCGFPGFSLLVEVGVEIFPSLQAKMAGGHDSKAHELLIQALHSFIRNFSLLQ